MNNGHKEYTVADKYLKNSICSIKISNIKFKICL